MRNPSFNPDNLIRCAEGLLDHNFDGILAYDTSCRYRYWNPMMEEISGMRWQRLAGQEAFSVFPFLKETGEDRNMIDCLQGGVVLVKNRPYYIAETKKQGVFDAIYGPIRDQADEIIGGYGIIKDVTRRYVAETMRSHSAKEDNSRDQPEVADRSRLQGLGLAIAERRRCMGLSQEEFAFRARLHRTYVSDLERGTRNISTLNLLRVASALELESWVLMAYAEMMTNKTPDIDP